MHKLLLIAILLTCALATLSCTSAGVRPNPVVCPQPPIPPASLMQPPTTLEKVRAELFEPSPKVKPKP